MTTSTKNRVLPFILAAVCLAAGLGLGVLSGDSELDQASVNSGRSAEQSAEGKQLKTLQQDLLSTLVLPTDFQTVPDFSLLDVDGEPLDQTMLDAHWNVLFFGFTHCPDVCPITLSVMQDVVAQLETMDVPQPQMIFVTVDPLRDTPEVMKNYVGYFNKDFIGVTGELNDIHQLIRALGIVAAFRVKEDNPDEYDVDHTASMLLVDPQRRVRAKLTAPHAADTIVTDYTTLMRALAPTQNALLD